MATRSLIEDMTMSFCELFNRKMSDQLVDAWVEALKRYRDQDVTRAGHKAMEECSKFPTPLDVIQRIAIGDTLQNEDYFVSSGQCSLCGRYGMMISEPTGHPYRCRECYTGLTNAEIGAKFKELGELLHGSEIEAKRL